MPYQILEKNILTLKVLAGQVYTENIYFCGKVVMSCIQILHFPEFFQICLISSFPFLDFFKQLYYFEKQQQYKCLIFSLIILKKRYQYIFSNFGIKKKNWPTNTKNCIFLFRVLSLLRRNSLGQIFIYFISGDLRICSKYG